jgi:hypothetical protein
VRTTWSVDPGARHTAGLAALTDPVGSGPLFLAAAVPWTTSLDDHLRIGHVTSTLADFATPGEIDHYVSVGYNSLLIGQRAALVRDGEVVGSWPHDTTGRPAQWLGGRGHTWAFVAEEPKARVLDTGPAGRVFETAMAQSERITGTVVLVRELLWDAHWH